MWIRRTREKLNAVRECRRGRTDGPYYFRTVRFVRMFKTCIHKSHAVPKRRTQTQKPKTVCHRIVTIIAVFRSKTHPETIRTRISTVEDPRPAFDTRRKQLKRTFFIVHKLCRSFKCMCIHRYVFTFSIVSGGGCVTGKRRTNADLVTPSYYCRSVRFSLLVNRP